ncbi:MAG TPA: alpha-amylase family glycosyl hydrolase, partial [Candidatus Limnocylindrales bacterium]|nr:alpha-amylase family glycosyl hydrolase [Candidatus Limnocylindrales bacterium]
NPGYGGPDGQDVWHEAGGRFYYGLFGPGLPDLNLGNAEVTAELREVARYWLTDIGVDGFRLDAIKHLVEADRTQVHTAATHEWLRGFRAAVAATRPGVLLVGEVSDVAAGGSQYVPEDVDLVFDFGVAGATVDAVRAGQGGQLRTAVDDAIRLFRPGERASFLTNHDQDRVASRLRGDEPSLALAARMLLSDPGVPFVYYGEEIGLTGEKPDERIRTPMPWDASRPGGGFTTGTPWEALEPGWEDRNVANQGQDPESLLSAYRGAIRLRLEHPALRGGETILLESDNDAVIATLRAAGAERLLVVANLGDAGVSDYALALERSELCGDVRASLAGGESTGPGPDVSSPRIDASGGFADYRPVPELPARSLTIIALEP